MGGGGAVNLGGNPKIIRGINPLAIQVNRLRNNIQMAQPIKFRLPRQAPQQLSRVRDLSIPAMPVSDKNLLRPLSFRPPQPGPVILPGVQSRFPATGVPAVPAAVPVGQNGLLAAPWTPGVGQQNGYPKPCECTGDDLCGFPPSCCPTASEDREAVFTDPVIKAGNIANQFSVDAIIILYAKVCVPRFCYEPQLPKYYRPLCLSAMAGWIQTCEVHDIVFKYMNRNGDTRCQEEMIENLPVVDGSQTDDPPTWFIPEAPKIIEPGNCDVVTLEDDPAIGVAFFVEGGVTWYPVEVKGTWGFRSHVVVQCESCMDPLCSWYVIGYVEWTIEWNLRIMNPMGKIVQVDKPEIKISDWNNRSKLQMSPFVPIPCSSFKLPEPLCTMRRCYTESVSASQNPRNIDCP